MLKQVQHDRLFFYVIPNLFRDLTNWKWKHQTGKMLKQVQHDMLVCYILVNVFITLILSCHPEFSSGSYQLEISFLQSLFFIQNLCILVFSKFRKHTTPYIFREMQNISAYENIPIIRKVKYYKLLLIYLLLLIQFELSCFLYISLITELCITPLTE